MTRPESIRSARASNARTSTERTLAREQARVRETLEAYRADMSLVEKDLEDILYQRNKAWEEKRVLEKQTAWTLAARWARRKMGLKTNARVEPVPTREKGQP